MPETEMITIWDYHLVALSILIAIVGSYVALDFAGRMRGTQEKKRWLWFAGGAFMMAMAIWSMHFVGMLALIMPMPVTYNETLMALSILAAAVGAGIAFAILSRPTLGKTHMATGSIAMGLAIATMHYTGMASMQMPNTTIYYEPFLFTLSVVIAIIASAGALWLAFKLNPDKANIWFYQKVGSAIVMGIAISGMHYTGMASAHYYHTGEIASVLANIPTVGTFKLSDLLIGASALFSIALLLLSSQVTKERQNITSSLQQSESRKAAILDSSLDAIITMDKQGLVVEWNSAAEKLLGYTAKEALGQEMANLIIPEQYRQAHRNGLEHYQATGEAPLLGKRIEMTAVHKNGREFPVELAIIKVPLERRTLFTGTLRDISERKKAEEKILQLTENLEKRVLERTLQLETVNNELEAFSYSVSHDLRAPLRTIDGFSQAVMELYGSKLDERGQNYLSRVRQGSQDMAALIDDMLQLSRLTRGELNIEVGINLGEIAREIADELHQQEPNRQVTFNIEDDLIVTGDRRLLQATLRNLLENAWKFTSTHTTAQIKFGKTESNDITIYYVKDDGVGFDMQYADKLFGAFQRLHSMAEFPGTGVGLATVARIIHRHTGEIWAEAAVDKGAAFYFTLEPINPEPINMEEATHAGSKKSYHPVS